MELVIGEKAWSSWSMRPWLVLKRAGIAFTETPVRLRRPETAAEIAAAGSPSGLVPVLKDGDLVLWDSLAIAEYVAERAPGLWPADATARALARCAAAEMHSGFPALRQTFPMDLARRDEPVDVPVAAARELDRLVALWGGLRRRVAGEGAFLVGPWSIADAMFTPVATRLRSYAVDLTPHGDDGTAAAYARTLLEQPEFLEWGATVLAA